MLLTTPNELSPFATPDGLTFRTLVNAGVPDVVDFLAGRVLVRDDDRELPVPIGLAAEIRAGAELIRDDLTRRLLALVSQDFPAAHKLDLGADTERELGRQIIALAEERPDRSEVGQALYDLVARALIRCGHTPGRTAVPEDRLLTPDEVLELWVGYRLGTPVDEVDELVARYQAAHNPLVEYLFRRWRVIVDLDLRTPPTAAELKSIRRVTPSRPFVAIAYTSNDVPQTAAFAAAAAETPGQTDAAKPKLPARRGKKAVRPGPPRPRITPAQVTFLGSQRRGKTSLILDLVLTRLAGAPRAARICPGQHALALARQKKEPDRTKKTPGYDFDVDTGSSLFAGRTALPVTVNDIDWEEYLPETFGADQCQHIQSTDALIIPIAVEGLLPGGAAAANEDAVFLARLLAQYRFRTGLPIAITIPACDKVLSEAEAAAVADCRVVPAGFPRQLLTGVADRPAGRARGTAAGRMRHAALQNPGVARSLNTLRVVDRFFERYEPLIREAVALTGSVEVFVTMTSTKESGWGRTYGAVEAVEWVVAELEQQVRPAVPALVARELADLGGRLSRVSSLQARIDALEGRRESVRRRREANTTASIVWPWNKADRLQAQDKRADDAILALTGEIEAALGLKPTARSTPAARRAVIAAAVAEQTARLRSLDGVCPRG